MMLKVKEYEFKNGRIRVKVNKSDRTFVYIEDKFDSEEKLLVEIQKSIDLDVARKLKKGMKLKKLKDDLDA